MNLKISWICGGPRRPSEKTTGQRSVERGRLERYSWYSINSLSLSLLFWHSAMRKHKPRIDMSPIQKQKVPGTREIWLCSRYSRLLEKALSFKMANLVLLAALLVVDYQAAALVFRQQTSLNPPDTRHHSVVPIKIQNVIRSETTLRAIMSVCLLVSWLVSRYVIIS